MPVNGVALGMTITGGILLWSGIQNVPVQSVLGQLAKGTVPAKGPAESFTGTSGTSASASPGDTSAHSASAAANQAIARVLAAPYGWSTGQQWSDLVSLWNRESGWSATAQNPGSGAYGIPQALPADKMASAGSDWQTSASTQIRWGLSYIRDRYGSPSAAWAHEMSSGWY